MEDRERALGAEAPAGGRVKRRLSPREKKEQEYARDHYVAWENPHLARHGWSRKKRRESRYERRRAERLVRSAAGLPAEDAIDTAEERAITVEHLRDGIVPSHMKWKWGVEPLRDRVERKIEERAFLTGYVAHFRGPYTPEEHRAPFERFLSAMMEGRGRGSRELAWRFEALLDPEWEEEGYRHIIAERRWLYAFLRDAPEWEPRLRAWIARVTADEAPRG